MSKKRNGKENENNNNNNNENDNDDKQKASEQMIIEPRDSPQRYGKCIGGAIKPDGTSAIDKAILRRPRKSWVNSAVGVGEYAIYMAYGIWHMVHIVRVHILRLGAH